ncbi:hypothetical protein B0T22DRAFT_536556 [Podospora appendiculata]|uniref:Uncharacterized protein n=1 Tax=Podospora appendiculata TaxID=314037 RepID=A0AAE0XC12_9PEZI|nr:hypothetical protein B0T22DRAFT_536556 [Podospora appendiculata]
MILSIPLRLPGPRRMRLAMVPTDPATPVKPKATGRGEKAAVATLVANAAGDNDELAEGDTGAAAARASTPTTARAGPQAPHQGHESSAVDYDALDESPTKQIKKLKTTSTKAPFSHRRDIFLMDGADTLAVVGVDLAFTFGIIVALRKNAARAKREVCIEERLCYFFVAGTCLAPLGHLYPDASFPPCRFPPTDPNHRTIRLAGKSLCGPGPVSRVFVVDEGHAAREPVAAVARIEHPVRALILACLRFSERNPADKRATGEKRTREDASDDQSPKRPSVPEIDKDQEAAKKSATADVPTDPSASTVTTTGTLAVAESFDTSTGQSPLRLSFCKHRSNMID